MRRYENRHRLLACGLAALAGFVDAIGFLKLGGFFVSFMSGNSTRMAVAFDGDGARSLLAGMLIAAFVVGVVAGSALVRLADEWRKQVVLGLVVLELALAAAAASLSRAAFAAPLLMACGMGSANCVFQRDGEVSVGVTYMTGTLVKIGQHLVAAVVGGPRLAWVPYLLLWLGLVAGAASGAATFRLLGLDAIWIAVAAAAVLLAGSFSLGPTREQQNEGTTPLP